MKFKYYDTLSTLVSGTVLLYVISEVFNKDISKIDVIVMLSLAYMLGYLLNSVSAMCEPIYYWFMGGRPSDKLLSEPKEKRCSKKKNYTGFGRIRFYAYAQTICILKQELQNSDADAKMMFERAMIYSNSDESSRVPDFNAQYAFSRVMLTLVLISSFIILYKYYTLFWVWIIDIAAIYIVGRRCKEKGYYYAREVLNEYLKKKNV